MRCRRLGAHYNDVIMSTIASQITSLAIVYSTVYSGADQRKHQSSASLAFVWGIHRGPVNSPHKWPVSRKMFPFDDVIMRWNYHAVTSWEINTTIILICFLCVCVCIVVLNSLLGLQGLFQWDIYGFITYSQTTMATLRRHQGCTIDGLVPNGH